MTESTAPPFVAGCTWMSAGATQHNLEFDCSTEFRRISDWLLMLFIDSVADGEMILLSKLLTGEVGAGQLITRIRCVDP
jgi:hypothetical protein